MADNKISGFGYRPDVGLENVDRVERQPSSMPAQGDAQLTGDKVSNQLDALFPQDSLQREMRDFVGPKITDPSVLLPARFDTLIRESAERLHEAAKASNDPALGRAGDLLDQEKRLRNLLHDYRAALMKA